MHGTGVPSSTPYKPISIGGETEIMPQENIGSVVTQCPASKTSLGWINGKLWTSTVDVHWSIHRGWVKTTGNVTWL